MSTELRVQFNKQEINADKEKIEMENEENMRPNLTI